MSHAQRDADLILLAVERRQRGSIVPDLGPDDSIRPRADVQRGGAAPDLVPGVRRKTQRPAGTRAVLVIHIVAPQRQADRCADMVRDPSTQRPPLRVLRGVRRGGWVTYH